MISEPPVKEEFKQERAAPATARETEKPKASPGPPDTSSLDEPPPRRHWLRWLLILGAVAVAIYLFAHRPGQNKGGGTEGQGQTKGAAGGKGGQDRPVPVLAAAAKTKDVGVYLTGLGTVAALNTVGVKSRVDGQLMRIAFHEGQIVRAGDLLAEIDPRPFQVQLMQAEGQRAKDEAALQNAKVDLQRYEILIQQDSIPRQQLDTQAATVKQFEAALKSDQAQIESARLNLTYARVTAPSGGRVGLRQVDVGNVVHASDANGIVTITQLQPIDVLFTIPADHLSQVLPQVHSGQSLPVDAYDRDLKNKLATGKLLAVDNQIDPTTGTVRIKAIFDNNDEALFPNQFVNARLLVDTLRGVVTVPNAAIQRSPQSTFVYFVKPDHTVESRNVVVKMSEGDETTVQSGVAAGDVVVIDGVDKLRPGSKVDVSMVDANGHVISRPDGGENGGKNSGGRAGGSKKKAGS
ncbi:MAG TPA: MdtA/MuxA family multidrug efflux RND transporter periplasmic adaptor subunit [Thermoanaerobaculia bacterium]|jgi:multidrug efflux system membrane fusion protein|nr:MdtA/MuxA family multidrug efflux RND transporter periplasmic adaptor subunit [Thermoanaerobaculia bacterium]